MAIKGGAIENAATPPSPTAKESKGASAASVENDSTSNRAEFYYGFDTVNSTKWSLGYDHTFHNDSEIKSSFAKSASTSGSDSTDNTTVDVSYSTRSSDVLEWEPYFEYSANTTDLLTVTTGVGLTETLGHFDLGQKLGVQYMRIVLTNASGSNSVVRYPWSIPFTVTTSYNGFSPVSLSAYFEKNFFLIATSAGASTRLASLLASSSSSVSLLTSLTDYAFGGDISLALSFMRWTTSYSRTMVILLGTATQIVSTKATFTFIPRWEFSAEAGINVPDNQSSSWSFTFGLAFLF